MTVDPAAPEEHPPPVRQPARTAWNWLLVLPLVGTLIPAFYDKANPTLAGIPFFYWFQLLWIPIAVAVTIAVFRNTRGAEGGDR